MIVAAFLLISSMTAQVGAREHREADRVRITRGPLRGFTGIITKIDAERSAATLITTVGIRTTQPLDFVETIPADLDCLGAFCTGDPVRWAGRGDGKFAGYVLGFDRQKNLARVKRSHSEPSTLIPLHFLRQKRAPEQVRNPLKNPESDRADS